MLVAAFNDDNPATAQLTEGIKSMPLDIMAATLGIKAGKVNDFDQNRQKYPKTNSSNSHDRVNLPNIYLVIFLYYGSKIQMTHDERSRESFRKEKKHHKFMVQKCQRKKNKMNFTNTVENQ